MKKINYLNKTILVFLSVTSISHSQSVLEIFNAGDPFTNGLPGQFNITTSTAVSADDRTFFASSDPNTGSLGLASVENMRSVIDTLGNSAIRGTFWDSGDSDFPSSATLDLGSELAFTNLVNHSVISSRIGLIDIDTSSTSDTILDEEYFFNFSANFLDGSAASDVSDFNFDVREGTFDFANTTTPGVFSATLTSVQVDGSGPDILFSSQTGSMLRSLTLTNIDPSSEGDLITITGDRTLISVPEPTSVVLSSLGLFALALRRKRSCN